jgi:hypothetical protein
VVDDEGDIRQPLREGQRRRQLSRADEQVVHESGPPDCCDPADDVVAHEPVRIRLVVRLVSDPDEVRAVGSLAERGDRIHHARISKVDPADRRHGRTACGRPGRRKSSVSSRLDRVWTRTVASTLFACRAGSRSSGPNARRIEASSSVSHG